VTHQIIAGSMRGVRAIVTGGSSGIGLATACGLARGGAASIVVTARTRAAGEAACARVRAAAAGECVVAFALLELSSPASIREFASSYQRDHSAVEMLVCNAGAMLRAHQTAPEMGNVELSYAGNFLGHFALVDALEPALAASRAQRGRRPRVVQVVSTLERTAPPLVDGGGKFALGEVLAAAQHSSGRAYGVSKCAQLAYALELHRRRGDEVVSVAVSPGMVNTSLSRFLSPPQRLLALLLQPLLLRSPAKGAESVLYALSAPEKDVAGQYLRDCAPYPPSTQARSLAFADRVWQHAKLATASAR
jgi:NAD(P)-dependent dehydrogenase (short-subunit alcohol dehydrogenase family)